MLKKTRTRETEKSCLTKLNNLNREQGFKKPLGKKPCRGVRLNKKEEKL